MSLDTSGIIQKYVQLRDKKSELKKKYDNDVAMVDAVLEKMEAWLLGKMDEAGTSQLASPEGYGTAYQQLKVRANCTDWPSFWGFIQQSGRFDMLEKRVGNKTVQDYFTEVGELPPGINIHQEREVVVRRG